MRYITDIQLEPKVSEKKDVSTLKDIQLWTDFEDREDLASFVDEMNKYIHHVYSQVSLVRMEEIPLCFVHGKPLYVFTNEEDTFSYLKKVLLVNASNGLLIRNNTRDNIFIVLYIDFQNDELRLRCFVLDLNKLSSSQSHISQKTDSYVIADEVAIPELKSQTRTSIDVFDKVLQLKSKSNSFIVEKTQPVAESQLSSQPIQLANQEKTHRFVRNVILSGLRIRGLTDKTKTDYYQITFKSTIFALKKYENSQKQIQLNDIQNIVEKLLQVFIDFDD